MEYLPLLLFFLLFGLLMLGYPVAFTLGGLATIGGMLFIGPDFFALMPMRISGTIMNNTVLIAVPLFVFMGVVLEKSGIAERLLESMAILMGKLKGGMALSVIMVGMLLAATTGVVGATVVTMGLLSLPSMLKRGYQKELATGTIAAAGTLGQIIPPSVVLVLLGSQMNIPVGNLFLGAIVPGMLLVVTYMLYVILFAAIRPSTAPAIPEEEVRAYMGKGVLGRFLRALLMPLLLIVSVLGSIFMGVATPTEAAAVGALMAMALAAMEGKLTLSSIRAACLETTHLTSMVFIILVGASAFGLLFRSLGGDHMIVDFVKGAELGKIGFVVFVMVCVFIAGFFIDFIEIIFIFVPILMPVLKPLGIDPLWLAILICINLQTSFLTPPFGFALFYLKGVAPPEVKTKDIYRGVVPYIAIQLLVLGLTMAFPAICSWLPGYMGK